MLDGRLEDGEFEQGEKGGNEVFIALKEAINLGIVLEEAKEFHSYDRVDEEKHADEEKNEASARQDDRESLDDFLCEGDLIEHWIRGYLRLKYRTGRRKMIVPETILNELL